MRGNTVDPLAVEQNFPGGRPKHPCNDGKKGGFPTAARTYNANKFPAFHLEGNILQRGYFPVFRLVFFLDSLYVENFHRQHPFCKNPAPAKRPAALQAHPYFMPKKIKGDFCRFLMRRCTGAGILLY